MSGLMLELGYNEIISAEIAVSLRNYIASRNPGLSPFMRAGIFADAVNRIVDRRLPGFGEGLAGRLKDLLFRDVSTKPVFSVNCADVFKAAVKLKTLGYEFFKELNEWLSGVLKKAVARESLFDLVVQTHKWMDAGQGGDISDILDSVERSMGGLKYVTPEPGLTGRTDNITASDAVDGSFGSPWNTREYIINTLKKSILPPGLKRMLAPSAFAAAALSLMLFAGGLAGPAPENNSSISGSFELARLSYASAPDGERGAAAGSPFTGGAGFRRMRATAYDLSVESCGKRPGHPQYGITSTGTKAAAGRTVAVDPEVIPLGSRLFISFPEEYSILDGVYTAEDTGRLIKGDSVDIFFGEDREGSREIYESAMEFGVRYVDVKVLD
jgi:3D (Asp-Asp-Asp) domain-containing protein